MNSDDDRMAEPIAVVGLGCRMPQAPNVDALWDLLARGVNAVGEVPANRWSADDLFDPEIGARGKMNTRYGGFLEAVDAFDPAFFGISPREANEMDPQQRLLLEVTWQALEHGGIVPSSLAATRTAVYVGVGGSDYAHRGLLRDQHLDLINPYTGTGNAHSIAANRISYFLDLRGPSAAVDTACSSSLVAVHLACTSLRSGEADFALAGGVNVLLSPEVSIAFSHAHMLAADGRCKAFDASADGYVRGEGCGVVALKRLADARRDGNRIVAIIRGTAVNQDGRSNGLTAPNGLAQQAVVRAALASAGVRPSEVGFVEAHGTGTPLGDPIEIRALCTVLSEGRGADEVCAIGSIKTNIGHLETASGVAGLLKAILALDRQQIPAHLHLRELNPHLGLREGFTIPRESRPWPRGQRPRLATVNSYGFGGTNACVVLEEAPIPSPVPAHEGTHLLCLSARAPDALTALVADYAGALQARPDLDPHQVCVTAAVGREHFAAHRLVVLGRSVEALHDSLAATVAGKDSPAVLKGMAVSGRRRVAFLFSGQGAQYTGMGSELYAALPSYRDALDACARIADPLLGASLLSVMFDPAQRERLDQTRFAQPALFAVGHALTNTWAAWGLRPDAVMGHSLGELLAATAAGVFSLEDALGLVCERARLMQALPAGGGMLAVAAPERVVGAFLRGFTSLALASLNGPDDVVVSGDLAELSALASTLREAGIASTPLNVSHAFHSRRMDPMLAALEERARQIPLAAPTIPLVSNVSGTLFPMRQAPSAEYFAQQVRSTVRFVDGLGTLAANKCTTILEIGPSAVLTDLGRRSGHGPREAYVPSLRPKQQMGSLLEAVAAVYARGLDLDWKAFYAGQARTPISLPTYRFERERYWLEAGQVRGPVVASVGERHPVLGARLRAAVPTFELALKSDSPHWLADHRVAGAVVMPASGYLCLQLAAATVVCEGSGRPMLLTEASFVRPMVVEAGVTTSLQTSATPNGSGEVSVTIHAGGGSDAADWKLHASARVALAPNAAATVSSSLEAPWQAALSRCRTALSADILYDRLAAAGLQYGPQFRGVAQAWVGEGEAVGRLVAPAALASELQHSWLHPTLLDSAFQVLAAAAGSAQASGTFIPTRIKSLRFEGDAPLDGDLWVTAEVDREASNAQHLEGRLTICDRHGRCLMGVTGFSASRIDAATPATTLESALYELCWEPAAEAPKPDLGRLAGGEWIVLTDDDGPGEEIAGRLDSAGAKVWRVHRGTSSSAIGRDCRVDAEHPEGLRRLFADLQARSIPIAGIVHCWTTQAARPSEDLQQAMVAGPIAALHLVQALAQSPWKVTPRLWLVTTGALPLAGETVAPAQAPLWGLGRTLARELPELRCTLVDLPALPGPREVDQLVACLAADTDEPQIALRNGIARVARLRPRAPPAEMAVAPAGIPAQPFRLQVRRPGSLESIALEPVERRPPQRGEVELAVRAAGLNFRDVMKALGIYPTAPGEVPWLGDECAGEVIGLGEGVTSLRIGDRVVAMAPAAFSEFATTRAAFAARLPATISDVQAATVLVAFSTAHHGLVELARLRKGERVLIHGGAGGVGMAAIQVARDIGAEIFATAGTPERRALLLDMGVSHVFDSRSLGFAEEILDVTGRQGVDVVLNSLVGEALAKSFSLLAPFGRFVEIGKRAIYQNQQLDLLPFLRNLSFFSVDIERFFREKPQDGAALLRRVLDLIAEGRYQPLPATEFSMTQGREAFRYMAQSQHVGKVVLRVPRRGDHAVSTGRLSPDATYLISGGSGALGLQVARSMVAQGARHLVLCARATPEGTAATTIAELRAAGAEVRFEQLDVADTARVHGLIAQILETMPPLRGVVHAAGIVDDGVVLKQTAERCLAVMRPKISGAWNLHAATERIPLDFFITFSSVASVIGSPGQASYAAGNAFLDSLAGLRRRLGLAALNINWGPWAEAGMAARVGQRESALKLIRSIVPDRGVDLLWRLVDEHPQEDPVVLDIDWRRFFQAHPALRAVPTFAEIAGAAPEDGSAGRPSALLDALRTEGRESRVERLQSVIRNRLAKILGIAEANIPIEEQLTHLGVDSLMAIELQSQLEHELLCTIPRMVLMQAPTVLGIAESLAVLIESPAQRGE